jgi:16S rRNA U516 pseudouridylate synthase RsuA-like enzyme
VNVDVVGVSGEASWLAVTLSEGKNREIRKLMQVFGLTVDRLIRTDYGVALVVTLRHVCRWL